MIATWSPNLLFIIVFLQSLWKLVNIHLWKNENPEAFHAIFFWIHSVGARVQVWSCFPYSHPVVFPIPNPTPARAVLWPHPSLAQSVTVRCSATWVRTFLLNKTLASPLFRSLLQILTQTVNKSWFLTPALLLRAWAESCAVVVVAWEVFGGVGSTLWVFGDCSAQVQPRPPRLCPRYSRTRKQKSCWDSSRWDIAWKNKNHFTIKIYWNLSFWSGSEIFLRTNPFHLRSSPVVMGSPPCSPPKRNSVLPHSQVGWWEQRLDL